MRRLILLLLLTVSMISCGDDITTNSPIIQGEVNNQLFRSKAEAAISDNGELIIRGSEVDVITLKIAGTSTGTYEIGENTISQATFLRDNELYITAGPDTGGMIEIEKIDSASVTGNFYFTARKDGFGERLTFNNGVFFDIPFGNLGDDTEDPEPESFSFSAVINGENFEAETATVNSENGQVAIAGSDGQGNTISLLFNPENGTGEYTIDSSTEVLPTAVYLSGSTPEFSESGTITITTLEDNLIEGTFNFVGLEGSDIQNGEFSIEF
ncbi:MAG: DUF6252 family protein [Bacteroidota bacterium]